MDLTSENEDEKSPVKDAPKKTQETPRDWIDRWDKVAEEAQQERTKTLVEEQHQAFIDARHLPNPMKDIKALPTFDDSEPATKDNAWQRSMLLAEYRSECLEINRQNDAIREAYKKKHVDAKLKEIFVGRTQERQSFMLTFLREATRVGSPQRTSRSPQRTTRSPQRTSRSPQRTTRSPHRTARSHSWRSVWPRWT